MPKFPGFGRSRSSTPTPAGSGGSNRVPSPYPPPAARASSSRPSSGPGPSQHVNPIATPPSAILLSASTIQPDHTLRPTTTRAIPEDPHLTPTPSPSGSVHHWSIYASPDANASSEHRNLLSVPQHLATTATGSQQPLPSPIMTNIHDSRNVSVGGYMNTVNYMNTATGRNTAFMEKLLEKTIPGAAFDSSDRDPPPRCHPGTRLAILERCVTFIINCDNEQKMRWVFGAAGVGKSAILQSVAEHKLPAVTLRASIFFFRHGRSDGSKAIVTLAYQLAADCEAYREFIEHALARDPSLLQKAMSVQFNRLIVDPFIHYSPLKSIGRVLIIIDGLDECDMQHTQQELLRLISDLCVTNPSSSLVWLIASRPEPHITSFFNRDNVKPAYEKEEILVDDDQARKDVEKFLRSELTNIQIDFGLNLRWPSEQDFWKIAKAAGGLFVYAKTVTKYIGDPHAGNPKSQLDDVLKIIDAYPLHDLQEHPMALLDALYAQVLSKVPLQAKANMRKLLLALAVFWSVIRHADGSNFIVLCNWLGITPDDAYAALRHLFSVLKVPRRDEAHMEGLEYFHKSFIDYICDFARSGFSPDIEQEAQQLNTECAFRVLKQAPDTIDLGAVSDQLVGGGYDIGTLVRAGGSGCDIALTWSVDDGMGWDDNQTRVYMYKMAIASIVDGVRNQRKAFYDVFCIRFLATRFEDYYYRGVEHLCQVVFDKSRCHEFMKQGLVRQLPVKVLKFSYLTWYVELRFNRPITSSINVRDPWNPSCHHGREGEWGQDEPQAWTTQFVVDTYYLGLCDFCRERLERQLENWQTKVPDHPVLVLFTSTEKGFVEFKFVDEEDGVSEWTYWLVHKFTEERRKELGSIV